jgi:hypothetical protein
MLESVREGTGWGERDEDTGGRGGMWAEEVEMKWWCNGRLGA